MILGFPWAKQGLCHTKHEGAEGIILWALPTVFLVYFVFDMLISWRLKIQSLSLLWSSCENFRPLAEAKCHTVWKMIVDYGWFKLGSVVLFAFKTAEDWKYTSFVVFVGCSTGTCFIHGPPLLIKPFISKGGPCMKQVSVGYSQKNSTSHYNVQTPNLLRTSSKTLDWNSNFSSWFSNHLILYRLYRFYHQINSIYKCVIIEYNVLHRSVSYWES